MKTEAKQKPQLVHGEQPRPVCPADERGRLRKVERSLAVVAVAAGASDLPPWEVGSERDLS